MNIERGAQRNSHRINQVVACINRMMSQVMRKWNWVTLHIKLYKPLSIYIVVSSMCHWHRAINWRLCLFHIVFHCRNDCWMYKIDANTYTMQMHNEQYRVIPFYLHYSIVTSYAIICLAKLSAVRSHSPLSHMKSQPLIFVSFFIMMCI